MPRSFHLCGAGSSDRELVEQVLSVVGNDQRVPVGPPEKSCVHAGIDRRDEGTPEAIDVVQSDWFVVDS